MDALGAPPLSSIQPLFRSDELLFDPDNLMWWSQCAIDLNEDTCHWFKAEDSDRWVHWKLNWHWVFTGFWKKPKGNFQWEIIPTRKKHLTPSFFFFLAGSSFFAPQKNLPWPVAGDRPLCQACSEKAPKRFFECDALGESVWSIVTDTSELLHTRIYTAYN